MSFPPTFLALHGATYQVSQTQASDDTMAYRLTNLEVNCSVGLQGARLHSFTAKTYNVFRSQNLTFTSKNAINKWLHSCDMGLYQNQLNMATWCATAGCGVSVLDHMEHEEAFLASFFRFHVYYQIRKILHQMGCPVPGDDNFDKWKNRLDLAQCAKLKTEFNLPKDPDFRYQGADNHGLGTSYLWGSPVHGTGYIDHSTQFYFSDESPSFASKLHMAPLDKLVQTDPGWTSFMLQKSRGFTKAGIVRLNDSLRTYVYCILGAQAQRRSPITGTGGTSLDAQAQFKVLLEDSINQERNLSLPEAIKRYEDAITDTKCRLNFAVAPDLYMIPANMVLKMGTVAGYNNNITVATNNMMFGINDGVNSGKMQSKMAPAMTGKP